jgi:AcrR family transcriptional regulator
MLCYPKEVPARKAAARAQPQRARLDVDERRKQLVALGLSLFSERTYDDVSIDELAQAAGISKGLLYHYFPTKRDFYVATVREAARQLLERTAPEEGVHSIEGLRANLDAYIDYVARHAKPYQALLRSGVGADAEVAAIVDETREAVCARLVHGAAVDADAPMVRLALRGWIGFVEAATLEWLDRRPRVPRDALRELMVRVLIEAVQATSA